MGVSKVFLKLYSFNKESLNQFYVLLKAKLKSFKFFRLPSKVRKLSVRPSVSGKGYATFYKYQMGLSKAVCYLNNIKDLNLVTKLVDSLDNLYLETRIL